MGAVDFQQTASGSTVREAFGNAVRDAGWEYGHGGYSGSIVEKSSFVEFKLPAGKTVNDLRTEIYDMDGEPDSNGVVVLDSPRRSAWVPRRIYDAYNDKWGPAVAIQTGPTQWTFIGIASS